MSFEGGISETAQSEKSSEMDELEHQLKLQQQENAEWQRKFKELLSGRGVETVQNHSVCNTLPLDVILSLIPVFDGAEADFVTFTEACDTAVSMIPKSLEFCLVGCVKLDKLTGDARDLVMGKKFSTMMKFLHFLFVRFVHERFLPKFYETLKCMNRKPGESVVSYATRCRKLAARTDYINKRYYNESVEYAHIIDSRVKKRFLNELNIDISAFEAKTFEEVFQKALDLEDKDSYKDSTQQIICQICDLPGHAAHKCGQLRDINNVINSPSKNNDYQKRTPKSYLSVQRNDLDAKSTASSEDNNSQVKETNVKLSEWWAPVLRVPVVELNSDDFVQPCNFLLVAGSETNILKKRNLRPGTKKITKVASVLHDITNKPVSTSGLVQICIFQTLITFHLVEDDLPIPQEGIISSDVFKFCYVSTSYGYGKLNIATYEIPFEKCDQCRPLERPIESSQ